MRGAGWLALTLIVLPTIAEARVTRIVVERSEAAGNGFTMLRGRYEGELDPRDPHNRIITDLGSQFTSGSFQAYCSEMGTKICYASVAHPRSNGQVERANGEVLRGLKMKTFDRFKSGGTGWINELPSVLWSLRTTPYRATSETPFSLV